MSEDDQDVALDSLPEDPPDKQERWRGVSGVSFAEKFERELDGALAPRPADNATKFSTFDDLNAIRDELMAHSETDTLPQGIKTKAGLMSAIVDVCQRLRDAQNMINDGPALYAQKQRETVIQALESAAIRLRDAEIAKAAAIKGYQQALDAFNKFVAPVPK